MSSRLPVLAATGLLLLGGCGEPTAQEAGAAYCETVREQQRALSEELGEELGADRSATGLLGARPRFEVLAESAPRDVADEWQVLLRALGRLDDTLSEAGVDPATYDPERPPAGVTQPQRDAIERAAAGLLDPRTQEAVAALDQQARDVCGTPLLR